MRLRLALPRHKILLCLSVSDNFRILGGGLIALIGLRLQLTVTSQLCQVLRQVVEIVAMQTNSASSGFTLLLAIERYIACIDCLRFYAIVTPPRARFAVISVWVISILSGLLSLHANEPNYSKFAFNTNARVLLTYSTTVVITSVSLLIIQSRLYRLSKTKLKVVPHNMFGTQKEKDDLMRRQLKLAFSASVVVILYVVCMLPSACLFVYMLFKPKEDLSKLEIAVAILSMLNTFANPFVYGHGMAAGADLGGGEGRSSHGQNFKTYFFPITYQRKISDIIQITATIVLSGLKPQKRSFVSFNSMNKLHEVQTCNQSLAC